jgi:parallel beta-helix repeat protein
MEHRMYSSKQVFFSFLSGSLTVAAIATTASARPSIEALRVVVNSNQDTVAADEVVTLREAIALVNGESKREDLTAKEQKQITRPIMAAETYKGQSRSLIEFDLPPGQTLIQLTQVLPPLLKDGLTIRGLGTVPQIAIVPAPKADVVRGLTILAHGVTVRGLSLAGFSSADRHPIASADIVIGHRPGESQSNRAWAEDITPKDVVIEDNWLGVVPSKVVVENIEIPRSSFGIYAFFSEGAIIQRNQIQNHSASGIITGVTAKDMLITGNMVANNGLQGMADGIRLEGNVENLKVIENKIQENAGSGIYLFNPTGAVAIVGNLFLQNGQRTEHPAIFLTGNEHRVESNQIISQNGPGIVVAADPKSWQNQLRNNQFANLKGLAIDLISRHYIQSSNRLNGDGPNRPLREYPSQLHIANGGMDAPVWISREFFQSPLDESVELVGKARPNAEVELYTNAIESGFVENQMRPLAKLKADAQGKFWIKFDQLNVGEEIRAIATDADYGTSEFSDPVVIRQKP